jgi:hypothetical protein
MLKALLICSFRKSFLIQALREVSSLTEIRSSQAYWIQFCQGLRVRGRLSTAFHPQMDGQTERQNQTLETYLQIFTNFQQSDWVNWLVTAEFAYKNAKNASTGTWEAAPDLRTERVSCLHG